MIESNTKALFKVEGVEGTVGIYGLAQPTLDNNLYIHALM